AVVAHEVKNPLAGIAGAIQIISSRFPEGASEKSVMGEILSRIASLNGAVEDLLLYARPKPPRFVPVNVSGLLQETVTLLKKDPRLGGIDVETHTVDCTLEGDAEQLKAVFLNLLINASQALDGKGKVRLSNEVFAETCRVRIRDNGPGIPREVREKVFEPFFTTKSRGTGLGLPLVKRVVEAHRGNISLDCPDDGGTVVDIVLPTRHA
ncbi:MAG: ATP-binding protein, partial [Bdellovibrionota bacterium]